MIPVFEPDLNGNELNYLKSCIESGWVSSEGAFVKQFEAQMTKICQRTFGVAVANGSVALELAVKSLNLKRGDEVICPTFTIISTVSSIIQAGLKPILVDAHPETWNINPELIEQKITPRTKALMLVHTYGLPADMDAILQIAQKYQLKIIEDAAEVVGQTYRNQSCGSFGDVSVLSFYANKTLTTGEGGMILTDSKQIAEKCQLLRNLSFGKGLNRFQHQDLGHNYRLSNLQAAVGLAQSERLQEFRLRKRQIGTWYQERLQNLPVQLPLHETEYAKNDYWVFGLQYTDKKTTASKIQLALAEKGIETRPFFYPMHWQPVFKRKKMFLGENYPIAEDLGNNGFYLPTGMNLQEQHVNYICDSLKKILL